MFTKIFAFCLVLFVSANLASMNEAADHDCPANQTYKECNYICPPRCHLHVVCLIVGVCAKAGCACSDGYMLKGDSCVRPEDC
ncbi:venom peptide SjAPI isoform X1 [Nasonia vitripennis]|uniref:TIL domain-containing protein n=1 Tax=Nasonia vitripennis TaxID=7425 RepID=A0A7M7GAY6_NASVI|nr:venom peptide SjAPI isoform X1 [Nasonia vitripennis]